ncbi:MAG: hypothetical protein ACK4HW_05355 [Roseinatronobacter sp.]
MKIAMIGLGHVALADALALGRVHQVVLTGPVPDRVEAINAGIYALDDPLKGDYLNRHRVDVTATLDTRAALDGAGMVLVSAPLSFDPESAQLQMVELESRIELAAQLLPLVPIVIRSAVPVGFTDGCRARLPGARLVYTPEFSREGAALGDILHPNFLIVGARGKLGAHVAQVLASGALRAEIPVRQMGATEAEVVRHLSILFQAARVGYFNELDSYALTHGLDARQIIDGVCLDPRIGAQGNNPCFGYGGANLPRAAQALAGPLGGVDAAIMPNLGHARDARITALADHIRARGVRKVGFYLGAGQPAGDAPIAQLRAALDAFGLTTHLHIVGAGDLAKFKEDSDIVVASRMTPDLRDIADKLFTRDHFAA